MLNYAAERAVEALRPVRAAVLATGGPAGVQVSEVECQAAGLVLYVLLPGGSDHLFNLEHNSDVSLLGPGWQLSGRAAVVSDEARPPDLELLERRGARWGALLRVDLCRIQLYGPDGWGSRETLDLDARE